jgi:hypothetical protein
VVGPGGRHGDEVAGRQVAGQRHVVDDDVAALAVLPGQGDVGGRDVGRARGQHGGVAGVVEGGADVVAHAAVDADVRAQPREHLDGADLVQRDGRRPGDGPPRLDGEPRDGQTDGGALLLDDGAQAVGEVGDLHRVVGRGVGDALAAAEVELGQLEAVLVADRGQQADHAVRGELEAVDVEDVRADVAVQSDELERRSASTERTASAAAPLASEKPNFWSSWPVWTNSCVCASTPGVTRT